MRSAGELELQEEEEELHFEDEYTVTMIYGVMVLGATFAKTSLSLYSIIKRSNMKLEYN